MRRNSFTVDGSFPLNTSGGQLSMGQAGAAGGHLGVVEAMRQLIGAPLGGAVEKPLGLASGFGMINYDRGVCSGAAILRPSLPKEEQEIRTSAAPRKRNDRGPPKRKNPLLAHPAADAFRRPREAAPPKA